jgi:hypothetical protein
LVWLGLLNMAYTVKIHNQNVSVGHVNLVLAERINNDGRFTCSFEGAGQLFYKGSKEGSRKPGCGFVIRNVRLSNKKPYCGNHPGECLIHPIFGTTKKKNMKLLEWDDWVAFHGIVNDVLDELGLDADVWTKPMDVKGYMWIRKGLNRRLRYDYDEKNVGSWAPLREWNRGTADQFTGCVND